MMTKKKIIIFTSTGGNGHMSVTHALIEMLQETYDVVSVLAFRDVLGSIDPFLKCTKKKWSGEDFYNYCLKKKWINAIHILVMLRTIYYWLNKNKIITLIRAYLVKHKPDMIISVIPFINGEIYYNATQLNIPFLIIPTDMDASTFMFNVKKSMYTKFIIAEPFDAPELLNSIPKQFRKNLVVTGLPIRRNFFISKDRDKIQVAWSLPDNKKIILIMMGGQGSHSALLFAQGLADLDMPAHLLICIGNYTELENQLKKIIFQKHITYTVVKFTHKMADLMAVADIIITKSGSVSFYEALYVGKPIILDATSPILSWEQLNHVLVKKYKLGDIVYSVQDIRYMIEEIFKNHSSYTECVANIKKLINKNNLEPNAIKRLIDMFIMEGDYLTSNKLSLEMSKQR